MRGLGAQHVVYGVTDEMYDWVGESLLATVAEAADDAWNAELGETCTAQKSTANLRRCEPLPPGSGLPSPTHDRIVTEIRGVAADQPQYASSPGRKCLQHSWRAARVPFSWQLATNRAQ